MKTNPLHEAREILAHAPLLPNAATVTRETNERMSAALASFKKGAIDIRTLSQVTAACETELRNLRWPLTA